MRMLPTRAQVVALPPDDMAFLAWMAVLNGHYITQVVPGPVQEELLDATLSELTTAEVDRLKRILDSLGVK